MPGTNRPSPRPGKPPVSTADRFECVRHRARRSLQLPTIRPGQQCPATLSRHQQDPALRVVQGTGPAGPAGLPRHAYCSTWAPRSPTPSPTNLGLGIGAVGGRQRGQRPGLGASRRLDGPRALRFNDPACADMLLPAHRETTPCRWRDSPATPACRSPATASTSGRLVRKP